MNRLLRTNIPAVSETVALVTVTAPGADVLPWSETRGLVVAEAAQEWNRTMPSRWSELHRQASQTARRRVGGPSRFVTRVFQMQARGVLHVHVVLVFDSPADRAWVKQYVGELRRLGGDLGFGFVDFRDRAGKAGKPSVMESARAAGYLSRYLSESVQFREAVRSGVRRVVWVTPRASSVTGVTMRRLRRVRFLYWIRRGRSSVVFERAGQLPSWFRDPFELSAVQSLAAPP